MVVLAQLLRMEAGLVLLETLFNWRSAWKVRAQVEMLEIAKKIHMCLQLGLSGPNGPAVAGPVGQAQGAGRGNVRMQQLTRTTPVRGRGHRLKVARRQSVQVIE